MYVVMLYAPEGAHKCLANEISSEEWLNIHLI